MDGKGATGGEKTPITFSGGLTLKSGDFGFILQWEIQLVEILVGGRIIVEKA